MNVQNAETNWYTVAVAYTALSAVGVNADDHKANLPASIQGD